MSQRSESGRSGTDTENRKNPHIPQREPGSPESKQAASRTPQGVPEGREGSKPLGNPEDQPSSATTGAWRTARSSTSKYILGACPPASRLAGKLSSSVLYSRTFAL
jgi:hypothetical protein